jgi:hypothetical protein
MFYNQDIITHDVQDNQLMNEGKTADHPIDFDCNNGGSSLLSNDDESLFSHDNPRKDDDKQTSANELGPGACAWGMEKGITKHWGNRYGEYCCLFGKPVIPCAHNGCSAKIHQWCQQTWLERMNRDIDRNGGGGIKFVVDRNGPFFCPEHNIQRTDYITKRERRYIPKKAS